MKLSIPLQLMSRPRKRGSIHPFPPTSSWCSAQLAQGSFYHLPLHIISSKAWTFCKLDVYTKTEAQWTDYTQSAVTNLLAFPQCNLGGSSPLLRFPQINFHLLHYRNNILPHCSSQWGATLTSRLHWHSGSERESFWEGSLGKWTLRPSGDESYQ
jgi:hypothetical protein